MKNNEIYSKRWRLALPAMTLLLLAACGSDDSERSATEASDSNDSSVTRSHPLDTEDYVSGSSDSPAQTNLGSPVSLAEVPSPLDQDTYDRLSDELIDLPYRTIHRVQLNERLSFPSTEEAREAFFSAITDGDFVRADIVLASVEDTGRNDIVAAMAQHMIAATMAAIESNDYTDAYRLQRYSHFNPIHLWMLDGETVRGRVFDADTREPVTGATVKLPDPWGSRAQTDTDGHYELFMPRNRTFSFVVDHPDYDTAFVSKTIAGTQINTAELHGKSVDLEISAPLERPELPSLSFRGRVVDAETGEPLAGMPVVAGFDPIEGAPDVNLQQVMGKFGRETDAEGRFEITELPVSTVNLFAQAFIDGKTYQLQKADFVYEDGVEQVIEISGRAVKLDLPLVVVGYVKDRSTGEPIPHARVSAGGWKAERTGERGQFLIQLATGKDWQLTASHEAYHQSQPQPFSSSEPEKIETEFLLNPITTGTVLGTAVNAATGEPIANAVIEIAGQRVRTDSQGRFRAEEIESGEVTVNAAQSGYRTDSEALLLEALQTAEATLELEPITTGTIRGIVVDNANGLPLADVAVRGGDKLATTGEDGTFVLEEVEAGAIDVAANKTLYVPGSSQVLLEAMASADTRIQLEAITWGTVRGTVHDATDGAPLPGAAIRIGGIEVTAGEDGSFVAERVPAGNVSLVSTIARYHDAQAAVELPRDGDVSHAFELSPITTGTIYVTVVDASKNSPLAGADVLVGTRRATTDTTGRIMLQEVPAGRIVANATANLYESGSAEGVLEAASEVSLDVALLPITYGTIVGIVVNKVTGDPIADATVNLDGRQLRSDSNGAFRAERVPAGSIAVNAELFRYRRDRQTVALERGTEEDVRLELDPITTGTVRGVVRNASNGAPLNGAMITIGNLSARSGADGRFEIEQVPAGDVTVQGTMQLFEPGDARASVEAAGSVDTEIDLIPITYGTVAGVVVDADSGSAIEGAAVSAGTRSTRSGADGRFELERISAGDLSVVASKPIFLDNSLSISLAAGETENVRLRLQPITWGTVSGIVTDADTGRPLADAEVIAGTQAARSDTSGRFRIEKVAAGCLQVSGSAPAYEPANMNLELEPDTERDIALALEPIRFGDITGQVIDAKTGEAIAQARVTVGRHAAETDGNGRFAFDGVDVGRTTVAARHPDYANGSSSTEVPPADSVEVVIRLDLRREDVTSLEAELAKSGTIDLYGIYFDSAKAQFKPSSLNTLRAVLEVMKRAPDRRFRIAGHTDSDGGDDYNQNLSERRAKTVIGWLVDNGIAADRLDGVGFGETQPAAPNDTESGKALNRRVQLSFAD